MKKTALAKYLHFLDEHKSRLGFADYKIFINDETSIESEFVASAECNWLERKLTIKVYKQFVERKDWEETLIHELIHASLVRINQEVEEKMEKLRYLEEEKYVNKLTDSYLELWRARK